MQSVIRQYWHTVLLSLCLFTGPTNAAVDHSQTWKLTSEPSWVAQTVINTEPSGLDTVGGTRYLLVDRQHHDNGESVAVYKRFVSEVVGQSGLSNNSKLSVTYDPGYQTLELHDASVIRNGRRSDRLAQARISVSRTEDDTDSDLLNGNVTLLAVLPDIRIGDTVEYRYTVFGKNPVFDKTHHSQWRMQWNVPVERASLRITVPQNMKLQHTPRPKENFSEQVQTGLRTLLWTRDSIEAIERPEDTPDWYANPARLDVSAYKDWEEVAAWGQQLFRGHSTSGAKFKELSRSIQRVRDNEGIEKAIAMAIDYVQKNIRYFGLELGENSHRPHSPDEVLSNGYGDCKDKALLLIGLLKDLGIEASPLLVSAQEKQGITERLPSPGVFDHVVVLVTYEGKQYWVDATDSAQAGYLGLRGQPEYGAGLALGGSGPALMTRELTSPERAQISAYEKFQLSAYGAPVDLSTNIIYRDDNANSLRAYLDRSGQRDLQNWYHEGIEELYGSADIIDEVQVDENKLLNEFSVSINYRLHEFWSISESRNTADFDAYAWLVCKRFTRYMCCHLTNAGSALFFKG